MGFFSSCSRALLFIFNFIFWLSGAAILGVGIWILVDPQLKDYMKLIKDGTQDEEFLKTSAYILIGFGSFVFLVGFCGCCGAIRGSKCLLGFYIFFLVVVFAGELAAGIYVAVFKNDIDSKLKTGLVDSIKKNYEGDMQTTWDLVQKELKCCGGDSYLDYQNSTWSHKQSSDVKIPESCCELVNGVDRNKTLCMEATAGYFYTKGCREALLDWVNSHSAILIGVGCGIAGLEIIGLICAICFCRHIDKDKYES
ncbi:tetraspanin-18-like [Biomphalaria glabrata]|uniref:Tetraspanin n=1 Tax=Biomphalaria glabrata TaxID=6526 RepID=A0A9W3BH70_BIOGL|nr:tetraspanin-18-like [Biomphalaria glabrata]XP_055898933.1 tetraspanin-18-like [Biomphalaria glabrata]XP_055898935.1 tetraspanin-18-like [Biomphalaria glabrata]KAI8783739.1 tetraspanin-18 [Biomphalaria glabrata]